MRLLDHAYVRLAPPLSCFEDGWGEESLLREPPRARPVVAPSIRWTGARLRAVARVDDGELESPDEGLPPESRVLRVRALLPRHGPSRATCVVLPGWGDEGFAARERMLGPVVEAGIELLLPENPFYGGRRRVGQSGPSLRSVSDFFLMGRAAVLEAHALLAWARERHARVGVAGYSMGGQLSAIAAALAPFEIAAVAMAPAVTPASVFLDGPLRRDVCVRALGEGAHARLRAVLEGLSVLALPPVATPHLATVVGGRRDAIVPPDDVSAIARHWGVVPRWLDHGHVSAVALRSRALAQAVVDTFLR